MSHNLNSLKGAYLGDNMKDSYRGYEGVYRGYIGIMEKEMEATS